MLLLVLLVLSSAVVSTECVVVGAVVLPHGGIALDPTHFHTHNQTALAQAWEIHNACIQAGKLVNTLKPDLILLSTPHGVADETNFEFYLNSQGFGFADTDNCACPPCCYNVTVPMDTNISSKLISQLKATDYKVSGLVGYGNAVPFPLHWGEVIPLHFLLNASGIGSKERDDGRPASSPLRVVVISQPNRRYTESVEMIPELLSLGSSLYKMLDSSPLRVVVTISADLAHTHDPNGPYGYSNASQPFDDAISEWAKTLDSHALLETAASLVNRALSCGFTGLVMLQGLLGEGLKKWCGCCPRSLFCCQLCIAGSRATTKALVAEQPPVMNDNCVCTLNLREGKKTCFPLGCDQPKCSCTTIYTDDVPRKICIPDGCGQTASTTKALVAEEPPSENCVCTLNLRGGKPICFPLGCDQSQCSCTTIYTGDVPREICVPDGCKP